MLTSLYSNRKRGKIFVFLVQVTRFEFLKFYVLFMILNCAACYLIFLWINWRYLKIWWMMVNEKKVSNHSGNRLQNQTNSALPVGIFRRDGSGGFSGILSNMVHALLKIAVALSRIIFLWQHPWNFICLYSFWASSECRDIKYGNPGKLFMWPEWAHGPKVHLWPVIFTVMGTGTLGNFLG